MTEPVDPRILAGRSLVRGYSGWAFSAGLVPVPLLDAASLMMTQVAMLRDLSRLYGIGFDRTRARALLSAAAGSLAPVGVASIGGVSALKAVPVVGGLIGAAAMPALAVASTLAVGEWFLQHLAAGGTLADADPRRELNEVSGGEPAAVNVAEADPPSPAALPDAKSVRKGRQPRVARAEARGDLLNTDADGAG